MGKAVVSGKPGGGKSPITYSGNHTLDNGASTQVPVTGDNLIVVVWAYDSGKRINATEVYRITGGIVSGIVSYINGRTFFPTTFSNNVISIQQNFSDSSYTFFYFITEF